MDITEFDLRGYYEPAFLHIRINTDDDIFDLNKLLKEKKNIDHLSTFLHEYIHFLQNITTTSGLIISGLYINFIKDIAWDIRHDNKDSFEVPVTVNNTNNTQVNNSLQSQYRGDDEGPGLIMYDNYVVEEVEMIDREGEVIHPKRYRVNYYDSRTREYKSTYFGSLFIREYIAHAVQSKFTPEIEHPDIPYLIAELIVKKEYPALALDPFFIVALCDASLMSFHPAQTFFTTIERMKKESFLPRDPDEVYQYAYSWVMLHLKGSSISAEKIFDDALKFALEQFQDSLKSKIFKPNFIWLTYILEEAKQLRSLPGSFFCRLVREKEKLSPLFFGLVRTFGTPFFTNRSEKGAFIPPQNLKHLPIQPYQLLAFKAVTNVFGGQRSCSLYKFCKTRPDKDITSAHCKTAPWEKINDPELCPFAQLWKTWGLSGKKPIQKSKS